MCAPEKGKEPECMGRSTPLKVAQKAHSKTDRNTSPKEGERERKRGKKRRGKGRKKRRKGEKRRKEKKRGEKKKKKERPSISKKIKK